MQGTALPPLIAAIAIAGLSAAPGQFGKAPPGGVTAKLVAETTSITAGEPFTVAIVLDHRDGWHTYYKNPGLGEESTSIAWGLPEGFEAGEIQWPVPEVLSSSGLTTFTYEGKTTLLTEIRPPAALTTGSPIMLEANVSWLQCKDTCLPGSQDVTLTLTASESASPPTAVELFSTARARLPRGIDNWKTSARPGDNGTSFDLILEPPVGSSELASGDLYFFPDTPDIFAATEKQPLIKKENPPRYILSIEKAENAETPGNIRGIIANKKGWGSSGTLPALTINIPLTGGTTATEIKSAPAVTPSPDNAGNQVDAATREAIAEMRSWGVQELGGAAPATRKISQMLLFAFLGGIILNIMPCVFPVLGIKIMGFVQQAGEDQIKVKLHGLAFAAGVIISLWVLVGILLAVRTAGTQAGWGFQLQSPGFLLFLITLLFLFALNLGGLFEIGTSLTGVGGQLQQKQGYSGSFFSGLLTVLVATPCTGPFMGPALGFALSGSAFQAYLIFTALALGVALPYVTLSFFPALIKKLPRPGAWMETFKQFMAFPLLATVVWLLSVYGKISGTSAMTWLLAGLLVVAFGAWIFGRYGGAMTRPPKRWVARVTTVACIVGGITLSQVGEEASSSKGEIIERFGMEWESFSPQKVVEYRQKARAVFIDFTAHW